MRRGLLGWPGGGERSAQAAFALAMLFAALPALALPTPFSLAQTATGGNAPSPAAPAPVPTEPASAPDAAPSAAPATPPAPGPATAPPATEPATAPPAAEPAATLTAPAPTAPAAATATAPDDDADLLPAEPLPDAAAVKQQVEITRKLALRRSMLRLHQLGGFATLAGLAATVVIGQLSYADKYGGGGDTGRYLKLHEYVSIGTTTIFAATGLLAVFAPSPTEKPLRLDTATLHKVFLGVATAGMLAELILGLAAAGKESSASRPDLALTQRNLAVAHQIIGYTTLVAAAAGFTVLTF